jgi:hypothetical protein
VQTATVPVVNVVITIIITIIIVTMDAAVDPDETSISRVVQRAREGWLQA